MEQGQKFNSDIEFLRAVAISITIFAHVDTIIPSWGRWTGFFWLGGGVDLFFAISGYLIAKSLIRSSAEYTSFAPWFGTFLFRRIFRLWPAAVLWSTASLGLAYVTNATGAVGSFSDLVDSYMFSVLNMENLYIYSCANRIVETCKPTILWHYWSLSLEEQFYFVLPFVMYFFRSFRKILIPALLIVAIAQSLSYRPWGTLLWFMRSDALIFGVCVALVQIEYKDKVSSIRSKIPNTALKCAVCFLLVCLVALSSPHASSFYMGFVAVSAGLIVLIASLNEGNLTSLGWIERLSRYIGSRSYSIYLVHFPVFGFLHEFISSFVEVNSVSIDSQIGIFVLCLLFSVSLADVSYRFVETPMRYMGRKMTQGRNDAFNRMTA